MPRKRGAGERLRYPIDIDTWYGVLAPAVTRKEIKEANITID